MQKSELSSVCDYVPDYIPEGKPARVVLYGTFGIPCGGTHVANLGEIGKFTIRKLKQKGETVSLAYEVERGESSYK